MRVESGHLSFGEVIAVNKITNGKEHQQRLETTAAGTYDGF